jgi:transcriptional regulator of heat shock response
MVEVRRLKLCNKWCIMEDVQTRNGLYGFEFRDVDLRRAAEGERKTYNVKQLWQRHHEIINLAAMGWKLPDIAEIMDIDPQTVSNTLNSDLGQKKLSEVRFGKDEEAKKTAEKIRILTARAIAVYNEIFDNESGEATLRDRKDVADTVLLELSGLKAPTKVQTTSISTVLTAEEIASFKERGLQTAKEAGIVITVESETSSSNGKGNGNSNNNGVSE